MSEKIQNAADAAQTIRDKVLAPLDKLAGLQTKETEKAFVEKAQSIVAKFNSINWPRSINPRLDQVKINKEVLRDKEFRDGLKSNISKILNQYGNMNARLVTFSNGAQSFVRKYPGSRELIHNFQKNPTFLGKFRAMENAQDKMRAILKTCGDHYLAFDQLDKDLAEVDVAAELLKFPIDLGVDLATTIIPGIQVGKAAKVLKWMKAMSQPKLMAKITSMFAGRKEVLQKMLIVYNRGDFVNKVNQVMNL